MAFALAAIFFLSDPIAGQFYVSNGRSGVAWLANSVINNLRQIDGAKQQFALQKKLSPNYIPTEAELLPYIRTKKGKFTRVGSERYVLNSIREGPYAVLDSDWRFRRRGWREGYTITNGTVFDCLENVETHEETVLNFD